MATNHLVEGDATALCLSEVIEALGIRVTRIARGIPVGGDIEFSDSATLINALRDRQGLCLPPRFPISVIGELSIPGM